MNNTLKIIVLIITFCNCCSISNAQEIKICYASDLKEILRFEKEIKSEPLGFKWEEIKKGKNLLDEHSSPLTFKRAGNEKIDLVIEYFFQNSTPQCTSVIFNWDNAMLRPLNDTLTSLNEYKKIYLKLASQFGIDTSKIEFGDKQDDFEKIKYIDTIDKFLFNNRLYTIELLYFYTNPEERRVRLYYSAN